MLDPPKGMYKCIKTSLKSIVKNTKSIEKINEITPLKDGNHKGRNQGDEDY